MICCMLLGTAALLKRYDSLLPLAEKLRQHHSALFSQAAAMHWGWQWLWTREQELKINSLTPGRYGSDSENIAFKLIIENSSLGTHCKIPCM